MGRTYKRNSDQDDFDDLRLIDDTDDDLLDWMTRPNEKHRGRPAAGHRGSRTLPDDWRDFDYGGDAFDADRR